MRTLLAVLCLLGPGCQQSPFELKTDRASYARGETVALELRSNVIDAALYNLCFSEFSPPIPAPPRACTAEAVGLPGFGKVNGQIAIPGDAGARNYQVLTIVEWGGQRVGVVSDAFSVQ